MSNDPKKSPTMWTRGIIFAVGILSTAILSIALFRSTGIAAQMEAWKLTPVPESYTELYFYQNLTLPVSLGELTDRPVSFSFNIHNAEGRLKSYPYVVTYTYANGSVRQIASGTVVVADGEIKRIPIKVTLPSNATPKSEIMVILPDQQQEIHFWIGATQ